MNVQFITQQTLIDADIDLTGEDVTALLAYLNDELQDKVGTKITDALSPEQQETMADMEETATDTQFTDWMQHNVPDMNSIVETEIANLLADIVETDDESEE